MERSAQINHAEWSRKWNYPELYPLLSVAPNGRVDVAWYDWRNDTGLTTDGKKNIFQDVYYASSVDGGLTWAPNLKLNDRAIACHIGVSQQGGIRVPVGIGSSDEAAYVAWDDTRNRTELTRARTSTSPAPAFRPGRPILLGKRQRVAGGVGRRWCGRRPGPGRAGTPCRPPPGQTPREGTARPGGRRRAGAGWLA